MRMRFALILCVLAFSASGAYADTQPNRGAPYSGFSDEFYYSGGRMTGGQSVYKNEDPVLGRKDRERFKDAYQDKGENKKHKHGSHAIPEYNYSTSYTNRNVIWDAPSPYGFLSPCQAQVQDAINQNTLQNDEIYFSGSPTRGQAVDGQGGRYNYSCNGNQIRIW